MQFSSDGIRPAQSRAKTFIQAIAIAAGFIFAARAGGQPSPDTNLWQSVDAIPQKAAAQSWVQPETFRAFNLNHAVLRPLLGGAPKESMPPAMFSKTLITLPMPDGTLAQFRLVE